MKVTDKKNINELLDMIEMSVHRKMKTSPDFEYLSEAIARRCKSKLSVSTLKRLWGYDRRYHNPYYNTLSILSRFLGFKEWDDFLHNKNLNSPTSFSYTASSLFSTELEVGDQVWIAWKPNRLCLLAYLGDNRFEVCDAANTKLRVGDSFTCSHFSEGIPLYLDGYVHQGRDPVTFVVGYAGGLTMVRVMKLKEQEGVRPQLLADKTSSQY